MGFIAADGNKFLLSIIAFLSLFLCLASVYLCLRGDEEDARQTLAPPPDTSLSREDNVECAVTYYKKQKYSDFTEIQGEGNVQILLGSQASRDEDGLFRTEGVLIYPDGESETFSVGLIYGDGAWTEKSAKTLNRRHNKRNVKLETALDHQEIKSIATKNDYVIPIGLASNEISADTETEETIAELEANLKLAFARGHNLGLAIYKLGWQPADRIWPNSLGYAFQTAKTDEAKLLQRPVLLIGANARRSVNVSDITHAAIKLAPQDKVIAEKYLYGETKPQKGPTILEDSEYLESWEIDLIEGETEYTSQILPPLAQPIDDAVNECVLR